MASTALEYEEKKENNYVWERLEILHPAITNPTHGSKCCLASASEVLASISSVMRLPMQLKTVTLSYCFGVA